MRFYDNPMRCTSPIRANECPDRRRTAPSKRQRKRRCSRVEYFRPVFWCLNTDKFKTRQVVSDPIASPRSTPRCAPVMDDASSPVKKTAAAPTSLGKPHGLNAPPPRNPLAAYRGLLDEFGARIRARIFSGDLRDGQRIVERDLAAEMGTSRGSIRDALRVLEQEGLVITAPRPRSRAQAGRCRPARSRRARERLEFGDHARSRISWTHLRSVRPAPHPAFLRSAGAAPRLARQYSLGRARAGVRPLIRARRGLR
jgi:hypothetical protein